LTVTVGSVTIKQGEVVPPFTSAVTGLKYDDAVITDVTYKIVPDYLGLPGTYEIQASGLAVTNQDQYNVNYLYGTLFVEELTSTETFVKPSLECVNTIDNDPDGFGFEANFKWSNPTSSSIFIASTTNNYLVGTHFAGTLPTTFTPGTGTFKIKFDGNKLVWFLRSPVGPLLRTAVGSEASSTSNRCDAKGVIASAIRLDLGNGTSTGITPNPTSGKFVVSSVTGQMSDRDVFMSDLAGRKLTAKRINRLAPNSLQIEMPTNAAAGVYMLRVKVDNKYQVFRVVKL
jgi:hypothetical protein